MVLLHKEVVVTASFGENLKALRKSRNMSQQQFAKEIDSNQVVVSSWERNDRMPSLSTTRHVAEVFHVPLSSLISLEEIGNVEDGDRELLGLIKTNPKIRQLVDKARYLSNADINMLLDVIGALTRERV